MPRGITMVLTGLAVMGSTPVPTHARSAQVPVSDRVAAGPGRVVQENAVRRELKRWFELAKDRDWRRMNNAASRRWRQEYNTQVGELRISRAYEDFVIARWDIGEIHLSSDSRAIGVVSVVTDRGTRTMMVRLERDPNGRWGVDPDSAMLSAAPNPETSGTKPPSSP